MLREVLRLVEKKKSINLDKGDDSQDIEIGIMVRLGGQTYKCVDDMGDNYSFKLEDGKGNAFIYDAMADDLEPYNY